MNLSAREAATMLAALRLWQDTHDRTQHQKPPCDLHQWLHEIATDGSSFERLSRPDIDELCERLNQPSDDPPQDGRISRILHDDVEVSAGQTVGDLLDAGGALIDRSMEAPYVLFQVEGDARWWAPAGTVEFMIWEANPDTVREALEQEAAEQQSEEDQSRD